MKSPFAPETYEECLKRVEPAQRKEWEKKCLPIKEKNAKRTAFLDAQPDSYWMVTDPTTGLDWMPEKNYCLDRIPEFRVSAPKGWDKQQVKNRTNAHRINLLMQEVDLIITKRVNWVRNSRSALLTSKKAVYQHWISELEKELEKYD